MIICLGWIPKDKVKDFNAGNGIVVEEYSADEDD